MNNYTGQLIRELREKRSLSQSMVSSYMGFTNVFLGRVESGQCGLPVKHAEKLARVLKCDKEDIVRAIKRDMAAKIDQKQSDGLAIGVLDADYCSIVMGFESSRRIDIGDQQAPVFDTAHVGTQAAPGLEV